MRSGFTIDALRAARPVEYQRWVQGAAWVVALAFAVTTLGHAVDGWPSGPIGLVEPAVVLAALTCVWLNRAGHSRLAAWILVCTVAMEMSLSLLFAVRAQGLDAAIGVSALVTGVGLLLGARQAIAAAFLLTLTASVPHALGWTNALSGPTTTVGVLTAIGVSTFAIAGMLFVYERSFGLTLQSAQQNEEQARRLIDDSPDGILALDASGTVEIANAAAAEVLGVEEAALRGAPLATLEIADPESGRALGIGELAGGGLRPLTARDGSLRLEVRVSRRPEVHALGGWLLTLRDVTARRVAEEKNQELQAQLQHAQKMEAIGRLAGGVAHDFNNLLTVIGGYAEILSESPDEETQAIARQQLEAHDRCSALTRQLLSFARREVVARKPLDLTRLVSDLEPLLLRALGEGISLDLDLRGPCPVVGDAGQLEQVLLNLATNARDASDGKGTLSIACLADAEIVVLKVRDQGAGMDEPTRQRLFEPFFTTKERDKGTGLGLATVRGIVLDHGGSIEVESVPSEGSVFRLTFPASALPADDTERGSDAPMGRVIPGTVLVVDDAEMTREAIQRQLQRAGYDVVSAGSGAEALGILRSSSQPIDVLLTDVVMPAMTGPELAERARRIMPALPVLFMSGYTDDALDTDAIDVEHDLLLKPFSRSSLVKRLQRKLTKPPQGKTAPMRVDDAN